MSTEPSLTSCSDSACAPSVSFEVDVDRPAPVGRLAEALAEGVEGDVRRVLLGLVESELERRRGGVASPPSVSAAPAPAQAVRASAMTPTVDPRASLVAVRMCVSFEHSVRGEWRERRPRRAGGHRWPPAPARWTSPLPCAVSRQRTGCPSPRRSIPCGHPPDGNWLPCVVSRPGRSGCTRLPSRSGCGGWSPPRTAPTGDRAVEARSRSRDGSSIDRTAVLGSGRRAPPRSSRIRISTASDPRWRSGAATVVSGGRAEIRAEDVVEARTETSCGTRRAEPDHPADGADRDEVVVRDRRRARAARERLRRRARLPASAGRGPSA